MQTVSSTFLTALQATTKKTTWLLEFYDADAVPGTNGFDPSDPLFLFGFSMIRNSGEALGITWLGETFDRKLLSVPSINKKIGKELNSATFQLSNMSREMWAFERDNGFEGLICVARLIDYATSTVLADSLVAFVGRCEKVQNFSRSNETATLTIKQILNATDTDLLRRTYSPNDVLGRIPSDPLFEGFRFTARNDSIPFKEKVRRGGLLGLFGFKKTVKRTLQYSSHSDASSETFVPLILGRAQSLATLLGFEDIGTQINFTAAFCDGYENGIAGYQETRSVTEGFPINIDNSKFGQAGGTGTQLNDNPAWVASGYYSHLAYIDGYATGSELSEDDPAPEIVSIIHGLKIPTPDSNGDFVNTEWSDNAVELGRWVLNSPNIFNLSSSWFDDVDNMISRNYCDHVLVDTSNTEVALFNTNQTDFAGTDYKLYKSTGFLNPAWYDWDSSGGGLREDAAFEEANYKFFSGTPLLIDDFTGSGSPDFAYGGETAIYRRRYTFNIRIGEQMKALDFLYKILFPSCNGFIRQSAEGKLSIRINRPTDTTFMETAAIVTDTSIEVQNVMPWIGNFGKILIGANISTSEVRTITAYAYSAGGQAITASGGITSSNATLSGGSSTVAPNSTLTATTNTGTKTVTIDGFQLDYVTQASDTTTTVAGAVAGLINSHAILNKHVKATWNKNTTVLVESRVGTLTLNSALENAHAVAIADATTAPVCSIGGGGDLEAGTYLVNYSWDTGTGETLVSTNKSIVVAASQNIVVDPVTPPAGTTVNWYSSIEAGGVRPHRILNNDGSGFTISKANLPTVFDPPEPNVNLTSEEVHHVDLVFSDKAETQSALTSSNVLKGTFKFPFGKRQPSINRIELKYRDSSQDFQSTTFTLNDKDHQDKIKKVNTLKIDGSGIDNHHQAVRVANQAMNANREGDFFFGLSGDGEALLLEEGDIVCVTDESGEFVNEPIRIEEVSITNQKFPQISILGRRYRRWFYDDQSTEKLVPIPIVANQAANRETAAPSIADSDTPTNTVVNFMVEDFSDTVKFIKWDLDKVDTFDGGDLETFEVSAQTNAQRTFDSQIEVTKSTSEPAAEAWYARSSVSTNGVKWSDPSPSVAIIFADNGGSGGIGMSAPPSALQALWDDGNTEADLSWTRGGGSASQTVQRKLSTEPETSFANVTTSVGSGATTYSDTGLSKSQAGAVTYNYRVRDNTIVGWSNTASVVVPIADNPPSLAGEWDDGNLEVDLTATPGNAAGSGDYTFEHKTTGSFTTLVTQASATYSHSRTKAGSAVDNFYRVKRAVPSGEYSNEVPVQVPADASPPTLDTIGWDAGTLVADYNWTNNGGAGQFTVEYKKASSGTWLEASSTVSSGVVTFDVEDIVPESKITQWEGRIKRNDVSGWSNEVTFFVDAL